MRLIVLLAGAVAVSGCATDPGAITAAYVSPVPYESFSCIQLREEAIRVSDRAAEVAGVQRKRMNNDAVATGVAIIVFWPAAFFIKGNNATEQEVAQLKGQRIAIYNASAKKHCGIEFQPDGTPVAAVQVQ